MKKLTYEDLFLLLSKIPLERMRDHVTFLYDGEFHSINKDQFKKSNENNDVLDEGHFYFELDNKK